MFVFHLILRWCVVFLNASDSAQVFIVCVLSYLSLEIQTSKGDVWHPINRFKPSVSSDALTFIYVSVSSDALTFIYVSVSSDALTFIYVSCLEWCPNLYLYSVMRGVCSLCWYWWNCWSSLFELSFHNNISCCQNILICTFCHVK